MFDEKGMLTDRARGILFWISMALIAIVAISAVLFIFRSCSQTLSPSRDAVLIISPSDTFMCTGDQRQFTVEGAEGTVAWEASEGCSINQSGFFVASSAPGRCTVTASVRDARQEESVEVEVIACTPTTTPLPPTPAPTATPTPGGVVLAPDDPQGDVRTAAGGVPAAVPVGVDIRSASVASDLSVVLQPSAADVPEGLAGFAGEGDVLVWIQLYEALPAVSTADIDWIFALDLDGSATSGRPAGSSQTGIDAGLWDDAVLALDGDASGYSTYFLYWDAGSNVYQVGANEVRYRIDDSRTLIGLAIPYDTLARSVALTIVPGAAKGRAGAVVYSQGVVDMVDLHPE